MPQIFHRSTNTLAKLSIFGGLFILAFVAWAVAEINRSSWNTGAYVEREQPVQFSHKHHTGDDGIDCRYCHTSVETSSSAGLPPTKTCMNCHSQIWNDSPYLEIVRESWRENKPIEWTRVHDLPDFAYFNHSIHVAKGVGCNTCHGPVDDMALVYQARSLQMEWCLECHREPERFLRPKSEVFNMKWREENKTAEQLAEGQRLKEQYAVRHKAVMQSCSTCHR
jgi:Cytochrome c7 and related cytochrome c/Class III cytochrome C family